MQPVNNAVASGSSSQLPLQPQGNFAVSPQALVPPEPAHPPGAGVGAPTAPAAAPRAWVGTIRNGLQFVRHAVSDTMMRNTTDNAVRGALNNVAVSLVHHQIITTVGTILREVTGAAAQLLMLGVSANSADSKEEVKNSDIAGAVLLLGANLLTLRAVYYHNQEVKRVNAALATNRRDEVNFPNLPAAQQDEKLIALGQNVVNLPGPLTNPEVAELFRNERVALCKQVNTSHPREILHGIQMMIMLTTAVGVLADRTSKSGNKALFTQMSRAISYSIAKGVLSEFVKVESNPKGNAATSSEKKYDDTAARIVLQGTLYAIDQLFVGSVQTYGENGPTAATDILINGLAHQTPEEVTRKLLAYSVANGAGDGVESSYTPYLKIAAGTDRTGGRTKLEDMKNYRQHLVFPGGGLAKKLVDGFWKGAFAPRTNLMVSFYQSSAIIGGFLKRDPHLNSSHHVIGINAEQATLVNAFNGVLLGILTQMPDALKMAYSRGVPPAPLDNVVVHAPGPGPGPGPGPIAGPSRALSHPDQPPASSSTSSWTSSSTSFSTSSSTSSSPTSSPEVVRRWGRTTQEKEKWAAGGPVPPSMSRPERKKPALRAQRRPYQPEPRTQPQASSSTSSSSTSSSSTSSPEVVRRSVRPRAAHTTQEKEKWAASGPVPPPMSRPEREQPTLRVQRRPYQPEPRTNPPVAAHPQPQNRPGMTRAASTPIPSQPAPAEAGTLRRTASLDLSGNAEKKDAAP